MGQKLPFENGGALLLWRGYPATNYAEVYPHPRCELAEFKVGILDGGGGGVSRD